MPCVNRKNKIIKISLYQYLLMNSMILIFYEYTTQDIERGYIYVIFNNNDNTCYWNIITYNWSNNKEEMVIGDLHNTIRDFNTSNYNAFYDLDINLNKVQ